MFTPSQVKPVATKPADTPARPERVSVDTDSKRYVLPELVPGSATARALYSVWSGEPIVTVASPPGGGKSTLIVELVAHLVTRAAMTVRIGCPTNAQVRSLSDRLSAELPDEYRSRVRVMTLAAAGSKWAQRKGPTQVSDGGDLFIVDEAYQASFADVIAATGDDYKQILLVGDPGQIGPVVTTNVGPYVDSKSPPHVRALDVFRARADAVNHNIDGTYRFGPATVAAIAPLYDFPFGTHRPARHLVGRDGTVWPELASMAVVCDSVTDTAIGAAIRERVQQLLHTRPVDADDDSGAPASMLGQHDIAVVVARNTQRVLVQGLLAAEYLDGVTVGTSDSLQGGQWRAVIALDPLAGAESLTDHTTNLGRLCVMASRHTTHLTWVHAPNWRDLLTGDEATSAAMSVREALTGAIA